MIDIFKIILKEIGKNYKFLNTIYILKLQFCAS
jgi:hypothetical protein